MHTSARNAFFILVVLIVLIPLQARLGNTPQLAMRAVARTMTEGPVSDAASEERLHAAGGDKPSRISRRATPPTPRPRRAVSRPTIVPLAMTMRSTEAGSRAGAGAPVGDPEVANMTWASGACTGARFRMTCRRRARRRPSSATTRRIPCGERSG